MFQSSRQQPSVAFTWTVSQVNQRSKELLERQFARVRVEGEISNFKLDRSGHRYFALKDAGGVLAAALFRQRATRLTFEPKDGDKVVATGTVTVYGPSGRYQLMVDHLEQAGAGALQAAFERLRTKLTAEGLFAAERKRQLPLLPRRVAVLTSPTGSVWRDILHVSQRRFAGAPLLLLPVRVQGQGAAEELVAALGQVAARHEELGIDVVIIARGGGSLEDLWAFNEEAVVRAVAASPVPVVSGVGHETDTTLCDFAADVRAPTPSAAAERVFAERTALDARLLQGRARLARATLQVVRHARMRLQLAHNRLGDGRKMLWRPIQRLAEAERRAVQALQRTFGRQRQVLAQAERRLQAAHPRRRLATMEARRQQALRRLERAVRRRLAAAHTRVRSVEAKLHALSPLGVLGRGYAIVQAEDGRALRAPDEAPAGTALRVRLAGGSLSARSEGPDA